MRKKNLMCGPMSRGLFLLLCPIHSLLISIVLLLLPSQTVSRAIPIYSQLPLHTSDTFDNTGRYANSRVAMMSRKKTTITSAIHRVIALGYTHTARTINTQHGILPRNVETTSLQGYGDSYSLNTRQKIGIGIGVPLGIIFFGLLAFILTKRHLQRNMGTRNAEIIDAERGFTGSESGRNVCWFAGGLVSPETKPPASSHLESSAGPTEVESWGPLSNKQSNPVGDVVQAQREIVMNDTSRAIAEEWVPAAFPAHSLERRRPTDLQPLSLVAASPHRSFGMNSQSSPGPFPCSGMNSPQLRPGHQSSVSSKSSSTLGLTAFFTPPSGHERHGSASTRISQKSRKGSTATMMTSNYDLEMATLSSTSEQQFPITPGDCDGFSPGGAYPTRIYRTSGYSCFDSEREDIMITPIKNQAYIQRSQSPMFLPSNLPSPSPTTRSRHRHSRTSSSGINATNLVNSMPSMFSSPKSRPGTSPLAASAKGKTIRKEDIRIINHETTYFDDGDDDEDEDGDSVSSKLPQYSLDKRYSRRHSTGPRRMSKRQSDEVDGEELWTDSEDERDSGDFIIPGGLGSRFGKKEPEPSTRGEI